MKSHKFYTPAFVRAIAETAIDNAGEDSSPRRAKRWGRGSTQITVRCYKHVDPTGLWVLGGDLWVTNMSALRAFD